jgi:UDP-glucose 4-epimerase
MSKPRSALVTGATGLIGPVLIARLLAEGVQVHCLVRPGSRVAPSAGLRVLEVRSFETDELRKSLAGISCEVVFHLASYGVQAHDRDPDRMIDGNIRVTSHLLRAVSDWPLTKFIYTGSCSEYGFPPPENILIPEDQSLRPASIYGAAKAATEFYGNALGSQLKIPFVTLRLFNVFGPGEKPHRLLRTIIDYLQRGESVDLTGGEQQRDLLHVEDVADALIAAASSGRVAPFTAYNVCSGVPVRIREAGEIAADVLEKPRSLLQWGKLPYRSDEPMWVVGDPTRLHHATSWHPKMNLAEGIQHMIAAVRGREHQHAV